MAEKGGPGEHPSCSILSATCRSSSSLIDRFIISAYSWTSAIVNSSHAIIGRKKGQWRTAVCQENLPLMRHAINSTKHSNNWSKVNMAPKEICFWSSNHVSRTTTLSVSHKSFNSKIMWFFSAGSRAKILFGTHEECSNNHPWSCKDLANANAKHMKNNANTMKFAPTKRLRMIIHNLKICYPYAYSLELSANPPGKPNMLQYRTDLMEDGKSPRNVS